MEARVPCPSCGVASSPRPGAEWLKCPECNRLTFFDVPSIADETGPRSESIDGVSIRAEADRLVLRARWLTPRVALALCAVILSPLIYIASAIGLWALLLSSWLAWGLVAASAYVLAAFLLNTMRITASIDGLSVRHGPVPWARARVLGYHEIARIYVERAGVDLLELAFSSSDQSTSNAAKWGAQMRNGGLSGGRNGPARIMLELHDGRRRSLGRFSDSEQALSALRELKAFMERWARP